MSTREGAQHPWIARTFSVESGPPSWPRGAVSERDLVRLLDALVEPKPGRQPKNYFVLLVSPHRNGNSALLASLLPLIGRGRLLATLHLSWAKGWDPQQYPRLLEALLPAFRTSQKIRDRFHLRHSAPRRRLAYFLLDVLVPVIVFLLVELLFAILLGNSPHGVSEAPTAPLQQLRDIPGWAHLTCVLVAFAVEFLNRKRELLLETFHRRRPPPGYQLEDDDRELLAGGAARDFKPLVEEMHAKLPGAALLCVDRSDGLDAFSEEALLRFLLDDSARQHGNRLVLLHTPDRESLLYRKLKKLSAEFVNPEETFFELRLQPVSVEDRKRIATALGRDERDAQAPTLVADLVESDTPRRAGLRSAWAELVQQEEELAGRSADDEPGPALLLALLAAGGARGPRQYGLKELRRILTAQRKTFQRWTAAFGRRPWHPYSLQRPLQYLNEGSDLPLIERRNAVQGDAQWIVPAEVCRIVLDELGKTTSYLSGVHTFWAVYHSERFAAPPAGTPAPTSEEPDEIDDAETATDQSLASVVDLNWQLSRAALPLADRQVVSIEAHALGRSLLAAFNRAVAELLERAQFGRAHALLVRALTEVVAIDGLWAAADFVSEVETLSDHAWRLAAILGVSEEILGFHKLLADRGGRTATKGIEASVAIWDLYYRGIALEEFDRDAAMAHRISGGDAATRARLENLRRYALNVNLIRSQALVVEGLELLGNELDDASQAVLPYLLEPAAAPTPDLFEYLVGIQCARARFGLGDLAGGSQALQQLSARVAAAEQSWDSEDLFAEAVWHLARAEACLIGLEALTHNGSVVLADDAFRASMALTFGVALSGHPDSSELSQRLAEEAIDALEDAHFLQRLCNLSLGQACLLGARVRLGRVLLKLGITAKGHEELASWEHGAAVTREMRCSCLHFGILITRALAHTEIEVCSSCIRSACQEALRQTLDRPARRLGRYFGDVVLYLGDKGLYREAAEVMGYALSGTPPAAETAAYLDWVNLAGDRVQFLRLVGDAAAARAALAPAWDLDPAGYSEQLRDRAMHLYRHLHLQACWCCEDLEDSASCQHGARATPGHPRGGLVDWLPAPDPPAVETRHGRRAAAPAGDRDCGPRVWPPPDPRQLPSPAAAGPWPQAASSDRRAGLAAGAPKRGDPLRQAGRAASLRVGGDRELPILPHSGGLRAGAGHQAGAVAA